MDVIDNANRYENKDRDLAIAKARSFISRGPARKFCAGCDEPIPEARRLAVPGCRLCIECQREFENGSSY